MQRGERREISIHFDTTDQNTLYIAVPDANILAELEAPPIEFDEKLWHAVVDRVTIYNDDRLVYSLKDGSEITVML